MEPTRPLVALATASARARGAPHLAELGAVRFAAGEAADHLGAAVRADVPLEPEAVELHGLDEEDLRGGLELREALARLAALVGDAWTVSLAPERDARTLAFEHARRGLTPPEGALLDARRLAAQALDDAHDLAPEALAAHLGVDAEPRGRALPDAVLAWQVVEACVARLGGWDEVRPPRLLELAGPPLAIADHGPREPRRRTGHANALRRAAREDAPLVLVYGDDDEAPARLPVRPRLLWEESGRGYLEAECGLTGLLKTYRLDRIRRTLRA